MKQIHDTQALIRQLFLEAAEEASGDTIRWLDQIAEQYGDQEIVQHIHKKRAERFVYRPTPGEEDHWTYHDWRVQYLTQLGRLSEAVDIVLSKLIHYTRIFYELVLKVHEAGMVEEEKKLIEHFQERLDPGDLTDWTAQQRAYARQFTGPDWVLSQNMTPDVHRILGFDILATLKKREAELFSEIPEPRAKHEYGTYFHLLFLYTRFGFFEEAERYRVALLQQFDPQSEKPENHKQVFSETTMSQLARLPDGFTPDGKPYYRRDEQGNFQRAVEQVVQCTDADTIAGEFDWCCVSIYEEQDKDFLQYTTGFLLASIPRMSENVSRTKLYDSLFWRRHEFLSVETINEMLRQAVGFLRKEIKPEEQDRNVHTWIIHISQRDAATALKLCLEQSPEAREESAKTIAFWLEDRQQAKELIVLFAEPVYHEFFHRDFIPKFLHMKLEFPLQWIDEQIASAKNQNDIRTEADLLISRFIHQTLFGAPAEAEKSFDAAIKIVREIGMGAQDAVRRRLEWLERVVPKCFFDDKYESDTEWKPDAMLRTVSALAFVGRIDDAMSFEEEYIQTEKDACDFAAEGLSELVLMDITVEDYRKDRYEQAKNLFRAEIAFVLIRANANLRR